MCIRDSTDCNLHTIVRLPNGVFNPYTGIRTNLLFFNKGAPTTACLLYTSDAADERSSVDLGGRRIIKKKNKSKKQNR